MTDHELTSRTYTANLVGMNGRGQNKILIPLLMVFGLGLQSCVNVAAPDKPIVINLNINIKQEVVYRLEGKANALIEENPEIF